MIGNSSPYTQGLETDNTLQDDGLTKWPMVFVAFRPTLLRTNPDNIKSALIRAIIIRHSMLIQPCHTRRLKIRTPVPAPRRETDFGTRTEERTEIRPVDEIARVGLAVQKETRSTARVGFGADSTREGEEVGARCARYVCEHLGEDRRFKGVWVAETCQVIGWPII
jgi:hypothetical protein